MFPVPDQVFERFYNQALAFEPEKYVKRYSAEVFTFEDVYRGRL
jgi:hypothetical protein